jgi:hypothetical protein
MGWTTELATACVVMVAVLFFLTLEVGADCYMDSTAGLLWGRDGRHG